LLKIRNYINLSFENKILKPPPHITLLGKNKLFNRTENEFSKKDEKHLHSRYVKEFVNFGTFWG